MHNHPSLKLPPNAKIQMEVGQRHTNPFFFFALIKKLIGPVVHDLFANLMKKVKTAVKRLNY
jgi:hypothetical protein